MSRKKTDKKLLERKIILHKNLEKPVKNLVGYTILLILSVVTLYIIISTQSNF